MTTSPNAGHPDTDRAAAARILRAAVAAADAATLTSRALVDEDGAATEVGAPLAGRHVIVLAIGKAAIPMGNAALQALERLDARVADALAVTPAPRRAPGATAGATLRIRHGAHPVPDASSVAAGRAVEQLLRRAGAGDTVLVLLSGGASAVAVLPAEGVSIADYARRVDTLLHAGADIAELNVLRRQIDRLKAGGMAQLAAPARVIGLVLSDVVGDRLDIIASGPLTPAAPSDNLDVVIRMIGNNAVAREGAAACATRLGFRVRHIAQPVTGHARDAGRWFAREALRIQESLRADPESADEATRVCLVAGGETTVVVEGDGVGGRNQELVLAAALELDKCRGITIGSIGTDGIDGPTDAAGAVADADTLVSAAARGIDGRAALQRNDAWSFFDAVGGLIVTGPTGTNVQDVQVALIRAGEGSPQTPAGGRP